MSSIRNTLLVLLGLSAALVARAEFRVGDALPDFAEYQLEGGAIPALAGKVVLVDFWASWCAPCKASFPVMAKLHRDLEREGVVILAIGVDTKRAAHEAFVRKLTPPFPILHDRAQKLVRAAAVKAMPTTLIYGKDGRLRAVHRGFHGDETETAWRSQILQLLSESN